jgi:hypothetical protein
LSGKRPTGNREPWRDWCARAQSLVPLQQGQMRGAASEDAVLANWCWPTPAGSPAGESGGAVAERSRAKSCRARAAASRRLGCQTPEYRTLCNPFSSTCCRKRRMNS